MKLRLRCVMAMVVTNLALSASARENIEYEVHDGRRPQPTVITPGTFSTQDRAGTPPSDAIVLFFGKDLSSWESVKGGDAPWQVVDGDIQCVPGSGNIQTKQQFGDVQLHLEMLEPQGTQGRSQERGNSGVFLQGLYEIQVLDNYKSETYPDGMAGAIYGQYPPLVNACRPQGEWQTYDIIFHAAKLQNGKVVKPARVTAFFNGVLVHDDTDLIGPTGRESLASYPASLPGKGPLQLQDHNDPVHYRNIWVRELPAEKPQPPVRPAGENYYEKTHH
jgi:Domain of Unknown Function (DUF1080)